MSEPIKPALTADEWARKSIEIAELHADGKLLVGDYGKPSFLSTEERHALAALALYGQPFGFSREDVRIIRKYADAKQADLEWTMAHPPHADDWHRAISEAGIEPKTLFDALIDREVGPWRSLASRIEALLPPE